MLVLTLVVVACVCFVLSILCHVFQKMDKKDEVRKLRLVQKLTNLAIRARRAKDYYTLQRVRDDVESFLDSDDCRSSRSLRAEARTVRAYLDGRLRDKKPPQTTNERSRYKVLPLRFPFDGDERLWSSCVQDENRITPVFNRNGYYYDRKTTLAWLEINGKAWLYGDYKRFDFELRHGGDVRLETRVFEALKVLIDSGLAAGWQREACETELFMRMLHADRRRTGLVVNRIKKLFDKARAQTLKEIAS